MRNSTIEKSTTRPQLTQKETKKPTVEPKPKEETKKPSSISDFKKNLMLKKNTLTRKMQKL